jgi:hypothetical protein
MIREEYSQIKHLSGTDLEETIHTSSYLIGYMANAYEAIMTSLSPAVHVEAIARTHDAATTLPIKQPHIEQAEELCQKLFDANQTSKKMNTYLTAVAVLYHVIDTDDDSKNPYSPYQFGKKSISNTRSVQSKINGATQPTIKTRLESV